MDEPSVPSAARTLARDSLLVAPGYVIPGIVSLIGVPVLFGLLGAANYGIWALMNSIASGVPPIATSSVEALTLRYGHRSDGGFRLRELVVSVGASAGIGAALGRIFVPDASTAAVAITGSLAVAISVYLLWMARLQSGLRFGAVSAVASIRAVIGLALAVAAAMATGSATVAVAGLATGISVTVLASAIVTNRRQLPRAPVAIQARKSSTGRLSFGLGSVVVAVGLFELSVGDRFVMATFSNLSDLGIYAAVDTVEDLILRFLP
ncbi:MAG: hypothetical protein Q7S35_08030, partial [Candidatus Limnocylindrales bacterium]|nr:hypothetical protein [Candidatus Limnocylindrales bacterium]